jgi:hypothetical protein
VRCAAAVYGAGQGAALSWRGKSGDRERDRRQCGCGDSCGNAACSISRRGDRGDDGTDGRRRGLFFDGTFFRDGTGSKTGRRMGHIPIDGEDGSLAALGGITGRRVYQELPFRQRRHARLLLAAPAARRARFRLRARIRQASRPDPVIQM